MIKDLWLIGIGAGNPLHVTQEGMQALRHAEIILMPDKGEDKSDLQKVRQDIITASGSAAQIIRFDYPQRDPDLPYLERVSAWHDEIARRWQAAVPLAFDGPVALLVWGDPSLYDSTLRIADRLFPKPEIRVIAGITALQALTAAHAIPFNAVGGAVQVTTGRNLRVSGWPENARSRGRHAGWASGFYPARPRRYLRLVGRLFGDGVPDFEAWASGQSGGTNCDAS